MNKKILKIIPIFLVLLLMVTPYVLADNSNGPISSSIPSGSTVTEIVSPVSKIYGSIVNIVRILAFTAIIFAGVRYMFASADSKANIKNNMLNLAIGAIIVFCTVTVIDIVVKVVNEIL